MTDKGLYLDFFFPSSSLIGFVYTLCSVDDIVTVLGCVPQLSTSGRCGQSLVGGVSSARSGNRLFIRPLVHLIAFAHGLHLSHDISEGLFDCFLQDPALALTLRVFWVDQRGQRGVYVLKSNHYSSLKKSMKDMS